VVAGQTGEGSGSILQGLTIGVGTGAGALAVGASPLIDACIFDSPNHGRWALVLNRDAEPLLRESQFRGGVRGGSMAMAQGGAAAPTFERCSFNDLFTVAQSSSPEAFVFIDCDFARCGTYVVRALVARVILSGCSFSECAGITVSGASVIEGCSFTSC